jgi:hypothetical protein
MSKGVTKVPIPGGSGGTPTGAMQFQNDWPGLFLRGNTAIPLAGTIRVRQQRLSGHPEPVVGMMLSRLAQIAEMIERDVIFRGGQA